MASKIVVNLDTSKEVFLNSKCKQNDDLILECNIFENGLAKDLTNCSIVIQALKADKTYIIQNTDITKNKNNFIANLVRDFTRVSGETEIEIVLTESSKQNTTFSFCLEVVGSVIRGAVESKNTVTILENLQDKIEEAGVVKQETEQLIEKGGAATKGDIQEVNAQLETKVNVYNTVNDMKNDSNIKNGVRCKTLGFREVGDGGGGYYIVTEDTPNGCNILKINDLLSAKLIIEGVVNFKQVGGNGWGQNDLLSNYFTTLEEAKLTYPKATSLNMTINDVLFKVVLENFKDLYIPEGVYYFNYNISIPSYKNIYGAGNKQTFLKQNSTIQFITLDGNYINLSDFIAVSNSENKAEFGIVINRDKNFNRFNNITVQYFKTGIRINTNSFLTDLNEVKIYNCDNYGLDVADENNVLNIDKCKVNECGIGIQCVSARNINISKSWIELCNIGILKKDKGNLNITDTYFERNAVACIKIAWGITPCELIKVTGCSFFTDISNSIINYHGLATTKIVVENSYFTEYDINSSVTSKIFEKGNVDTTMKPIFKNCFLNGGITMGITESDYTS